MHASRGGRGLALIGRPVRAGAGFARAHRRALEAAALYSARLPTREEVHELHSIGLRLRPYVLPAALCLPPGTDESTLRAREAEAEVAPGDDGAGAP